MEKLEKLERLELNIRLLMEMNSKENDICEMLDNVLDEIHKLKMKEHEQQE